MLELLLLDVVSADAVEQGGFRGDRPQAQGCAAGEDLSLLAADLDLAWT
ncbi:hypothetical protein [Streptomyces sp. SID14478]|nr:hypothetical protein [Streptomyces sp. SID14478]